MFYDVDFLGFSVVLIVEYVLFISFLCALYKTVDLCSPLCLCDAVGMLGNRILDIQFSNPWLKLRDSGCCTKGTTSSR
jgi:hypothetical protein